MQVLDLFILSLCISFPFAAGLNTTKKGRYVYFRFLASKIDIGEGEEGEEGEEKGEHRF